MYCKKCGSKLDDSAGICPVCGEPVDDRPPRKRKNTGGSSNKLIISMIAVILVLIVLAAGIVIFVNKNMDRQKKELVTQIENSNLEEYILQKDKILETDPGNFLNVAGKKATLKRLESVKEKIDQYNICAKEVEELYGRREKLNLDEDHYNHYVEVLTACMTAVEEKRPEDALVLYEKVKHSLKELIQANNSYVDDKIQLYESYDLSGTDENVVNSYNENMDAINTARNSSGEDYSVYKEIFEKMDGATYICVEPEKHLNIDVQQVDASAFPKVKLYLNIQDADTGNVPGNLDGKFFYINKQDATAQYVKQVISAGYQLNGTEALKVNMVADVSGSMDGEPLWEAKTVMSNFINSVQFGAGDMVELISFATGVSLEQQFTNDANLLNNYISGLTTGNMTSLYDALYTAVGRVAAQNGARCVIAFTDGNDNYSNCSSSDVIDLATRYHIPVFIIGVGDADYSGVADIAYSTGGMYYNVHEIISMADIYNQIYKMEKELYLIEYEDTSATALTDQINVQVGYRDQTYGGECYYSYVPNTLLSVDAQTFYTDGPEAVVERYMKAFDDAMTYSDFSYIEDCLLPGSSIYGEQQSYVQKGIREQLDSYEIVSTNYSDSNNCVVTTRETYLVQKQGESLKLMTQQCQYQVTNTGGGWKMTAFASPVQVLSKIKQ